MNAIASWKTTAGNTCSVYPDSYAESPRRWGTIGKIIVKGNRYLKSETTPIDDEGNSLLEWRTKDEDYRTLKKLYKHVFPLYCLDHSTIAFSTGFIDSPWGHWDCGQIGWIVVENDNALITTEKQAKAIIESELDALSNWMNGFVYGFIVTDPDGNELDACWGYYSIEDIKAEHPEIEEAEA